MDRPRAGVVSSGFVSSSSVFLFPSLLLSSSARSSFFSSSSPSLLSFFLLLCFSRVSLSFFHLFSPPGLYPSRLIPSTHTNPHCDSSHRAVPPPPPLPLQPPPFLLPPATVIIVRSLSCVPIEIQIASFPPPLHLNWRGLAACLILSCLSDHPGTLFGDAHGLRLVALAIVPCHRRYGQET